MDDKTLYAWSCDFESDTGEGILCRSFCEIFAKTQKVIINVQAPNLSAIVFSYSKNIQKYYNLKNNKIFHYIFPFVGILYLWLRYLTGKKTMYLNYLPLWNFFLFMLLPPNTLLGPITGGSKTEAKSNNFVRKYLFPKLYKLSLYIVQKRYKKIIFSTDLLKKFINKKFLKSCFFLFCLNLLEKKKKIQKKILKKIDILFYYNYHPLKFSPKVIKFINNLTELKIKIACIGEKFPNKKVDYLGRVSRKKSLQIMSNSKISLISSENFLSVYLLDCISSNVKILVTSKEFSYLNKFFFKESMIKYSNQKSNNKIFKLILKNIKYYNQNKLKTQFRNKVKKINKLNLNYFSSLLSK